MPSDQLSPEGVHRYVKMQSEPPIGVLSSHSFRLREHPRIFDELPKADIVSVSRPDARDISPMLLSYTVEFRYKQVYSVLLLELLELGVFSVSEKVVARLFLAVNSSELMTFG
ncbi:hypothetical protein B296_00053236 [Ensete ventricosum]|uniref:Uncharacterized protein n=1 Tax=Ensete ventricosum TaxID=4639 RepID=A0A426Y146_ENSVE|nr:hypothetical protein B296_00053236 [Ensete ventricosum]